MLNDRSRTSLTRNEILGMLLGWITGPDILMFAEDRPLSTDELEALDYHAYSVVEDLKDRENEAYEAYLTCCESGVAKDVCRKSIDDFKRENEAFKKFCDEVDDEISKGTLRVDHQSTTPRDTCYTRISVEEWIKKRCIVDSTVGKGLTQASEVTKTDSSQGESRKMARQRRLILQTLIDLGFDPKKLPAPTPDGGARSKVVERLDGKEPFENSKAFQHAWTALRKSKEIGDEK